jgi:hypothetical protein
MRKLDVKGDVMKRHLSTTRIAARAFIIACVFTCATQFEAQAVAPRGACQVSDPSPTPLNVRSRPKGKVVRKLTYETIVYKTGKVAADRAKKTWVEISLEKGGPAVGWVYREYITCRA